MAWATADDLPQVDPLPAASRLRGWRGSGTIFFSWCNLRCVFCQNAEISQLGDGQDVSAGELARLMLRLQAAGCHNINFVTPEQNNGWLARYRKLVTNASQGEMLSS